MAKIKNQNSPPPPPKNIFLEANLQNKDFIPIIIKSSYTIIPSDHLGDEFIFTKKPYTKFLIKDQHLKVFLRMNNPTYPSQVKEFYKNLRVYSYFDALLTKVQGKVITITLEFFINHLIMKNDGVILRLIGMNKALNMTPRCGFQSNILRINSQLSSYRHLGYCNF